MSTFIERFSWISKVITRLTISTLSDWLKNLTPVFQSMKGKTKPIHIFYTPFAHALSKFRVIVWNCDWFITRFAPVIIGQSKYFGMAFPQLFENL